MAQRQLLRVENERSGNLGYITGNSPGFREAKSSSLRWRKYGKLKEFNGKLFLQTITSKKGCWELNYNAHSEWNWFTIVLTLT